MKTAVVTGANGFLGRGLVDRLCAKGYKVHCVDRYIDKTVFENTDHKVFVACDLKDIDSVGIAAPNLFYHMAWEGVSTDQKNDMAMQLRNVAYAVDCYRYAHKIGSGKFIFPGSASEYAYSDKPIDGVSVLPAPCDAYAAVKASVHICLELTARQLGLPYVRILLPSIYGGQRSDANIITYTVRALLRGERPAFSKLEQMWEYVYIDDAVRALVQIGERGISGKSYPVGWGRKTTLAEYIRMVRDSIDPALALGIGEQPYKTGRVDHCIMDPTQTITDTQYFPVVRFEDGIRQTIDYIRRKMPPMSNNLHET